MCVSAAIGIAGAAASIGGSLMSASAAKKQGRRQAEELVTQGLSDQYEGFLNQSMRKMEADQVMQEAQAEAVMIKRAALSMRSSMMAAQAASGVVVGEGSAAVAIDQLDTLSSADTLAALFSGANKAVSLRTSGEYGAEAGVNQAKAYLRKADDVWAGAKASSTAHLVNAAGTAMSFFATSPLTKGIMSPKTQAPAPVVERSINKPL